MGIFDRIGDVIKSYLNDEDGLFGGPTAHRPEFSSSDPDVEAAFEELNDYLSGGSGGGNTGAPQGEAQYGRNQGRGYSHPGADVGIPESLGQDFAELGLVPGSSAEECKAAYKQLLKKHHPDRHAGHPGNIKKATEKSARINAAYDRIERWRRTGKVD
jgi:DnaJ-domain-containing protein 1